VATEAVEDVELLGADVDEVQQRKHRAKFERRLLALPDFPQLVPRMLTGLTADAEAP